MTNNTSLPVIETVKAAWGKVSGAKGTIWALIGLFFLAQFILGFASKITNWVGLFNLIGWLIQVIAGGCFTYVGIRRAQNTPIQYKMVKDLLNFPTLLSLVLVGIIQALFYIPSVALALAGGFLMSPASGNSVYAAPLIGMLLFVLAVILGIYVSVRLWLAIGAVVDKKVKALEAIKVSFRATKSHFWSLIGLLIANVLIMLACAITLGIGFIWGIPLAVILYGEVYRRLVTV